MGQGQGRRTGTMGQRGIRLLWLLSLPTRPHTGHRELVRCYGNE